MSYFLFQGKFPESRDDASTSFREASSFAKCSWKDSNCCVEVDGPVETVDAQNGIRKVTEGGKPSRSRFQLLAYNSSWDSSLIACAPLTGRGHQLRVHLQWLGFPIDGDVNYGGRALNSDDTEVAVQRMMEVIVSEDASDLALESISSKDVTAAKLACLCCRGGEKGIVSSFTQAQLLDGSQICLHALRYELPFSKRKRKAVEGECEPCTALKLEVGLPEWTSDFGNFDIHWLQDSKFESK